MVTTGILPHKENSHGRAGNRTRDLVISSQKLWPLDHEAGRVLNEQRILTRTEILLWIDFMLKIYIWVFLLPKGTLLRKRDAGISQIFPWNAPAQWHPPIPPPKRKLLHLFPRTQNKDVTALRPQRRAGSNIRSPGGVFTDCPLRQRKSDPHVQKCSCNPVKPGQTSHLCKRNIPLKTLFL